VSTATQEPPPPVATLVDLPSAPLARPRRDELRDLLETGAILVVRPPAFALIDVEPALLSPDWSDGVDKNVSLDPATGRLTGARGTPADLGAIVRLLERFALWSESAVERLLGYAPLERARTSLRPVEAEGRPADWRSDDTRLHVDAFPSRPTRGRRILRVFVNLHPGGRPRVWLVGPPFASVVERYAPRLGRGAPGWSRLLALVGATRGRRSAYDRAMLELHDLMKADDAFQGSAPRTRLELPPGHAWIVLSDQVPHAAISGQHALEQTFHMAVDAQLRPDRSPLRQLERALGRRLS